jgi:sulfatase maturation enzyme AslB (radical SAM superfamily)
MVYTIFCPDLMLTEQCNLRCKYCFEKKNKNVMDKDKLIEYVNLKTNFSFFPFGGEPLLEIDTIIAVIEAIMEMDIPDHRRNGLLRSMRHMITNGILIKDILDLAVDYNLNFQISMDGPKHIHDANRVYADGKTGSYDSVMESIEAIVKYNEEHAPQSEEKKVMVNGSIDDAPHQTIQWSIHGVVNKDSLKDVFEISKWGFELMRKYQGLTQAIDYIGNNCFQIIFEESYTDEDIDILIDQLDKFCEWVWHQEDLSIETRQHIIGSYLTRRGGVCALGTTLSALDTEFNIYPCHRLASGEYKKESCLGNVFKPEEFKNFQLYNQAFHQKFRRGESYSSHIDVNFNHDIHWFMWCPATNFEETESIYYQNPRYNLMHSELNRFIKMLFYKYRIVRNYAEQRTCD